jgi:hypothetical protein
MKHRYHDVIVAWAEGKPIQRKLIDTSEWVELNFEEKKTPPFNSDQYEWRIKPKKNLIIKCRVALIKDPFYNIYYFSLIQEGSTLSYFHPNFVKWMTDWIEYEITE